MAFRTAVVTGFLIATLLGGASLARTRGEAATQSWLSGVLGKITQADGRAGTGDRPKGTVTIRIRIASDGSLGGAAVDESSGKAALDERALQAVKAAAPFAPPPAKILTLEGFTELSFPLQLGTP